MATTMRIIRVTNLMGLAASALLLGGCVVGPKYHPPAATVQAPPAAYKESPTQNPDSGDWKVAQPSDAMLHGKWWEIFNDPELNALEEQLNINNQNIQQFFENFMAARAVVREARSQYFPTLTAGPTIGRSQTSANLRTSTGTGTGTGTGSNAPLQTSNFSLPLDASWAPDIWGKVRNTVHQAQYAAEVSGAVLENERLTEQA